MSTVDTYLSLKTHGMAELSERGEWGSDDGWATNLLIENAALHDLVVDINIGDEPHPVVTLHMYESNIENAMADRAFHISLAAKLSWEDVQALHAFLGFLINWNKIR